MKNKKQKGKIPIYRAAWLLVLGLLLTTGVLSRFVTETHSANLARTAKFVFNTSIKNDTLTVPFSDLNIRRPGDSAEFTLIVENKRASSVSEVAQAYTVTLLLNGSMPMKCTLTKQGNQENVTVTNTGTFSPGQQPLQGSVAGNFGANAEESVTYTLKVEWPANENAYKYANGALGELVINFASTQID